jgi:hypothetical protein
MSGFYYTEAEHEWFDLVAQDFLRWQKAGHASGSHTAFFVTRTLAAWYEAFPERHPRTYRQHAATAEQSGLVIVGEDSLRMHEVCYLID